MSAAHAQMPRLQRLEALSRGSIHEARFAAIASRDKKLAGLEKQISKLKKMEFKLEGT